MSSDNSRLTVDSQKLLMDANRIRETAFQDAIAALQSGQSTIDTIHRLRQSYRRADRIQRGFQEAA